MRSPCHAGSLKNADKNNDKCLRCDARWAYAQGIEFRGQIPCQTEGGTTIQMADVSPVAEEKILESRLGNKQAETKRRVQMSKTGVCSNCGRTMCLQARGLCGKCNMAWMRASEDGKEAALAESKAAVASGVSLKSLAMIKRKAAEKAAKSARLIGGPSVGRPDSTVSAKRKLRQAAADIIKEETMNILKEAPGWAVPGVQGVCLEFKDDRDSKILEWVNGLATEHRRTPEQQIMWILQDYIDVANSLSVPVPGS